MSDDIIADILRADTEDGAPVVNIGEQTTGLGFGADTSVWGNGDGFVSVPNNPSDAGAAQAIVTQDGHVKRATQTRDQRWVTKAGVLVTGDRAIVSDSEAWIRLTRASDKIEIVSGSMSIVLEGSTVTILNGVSKAVIGAANIQLEVGVAPPSPVPTGSPGYASFLLSPLGLVLTLPPNPPVPPLPVLSSFIVNATPMIVP